MINAFVRFSEILPKRGKQIFCLNFLKQVPAFQIKNISLPLSPFLPQSVFVGFLTNSLTLMYVSISTLTLTHTWTNKHTHTHTHILKASKVVNEV